MILLALLTALTASPISEEAYCNVDAVDRALRQTAIVLDEHHIVHEQPGRPNEANLPWRQAIGNLLNLDDPSIESRFAPRERVTIFIAHRDGSGMSRVFSGCLPFYSTAEQLTISENAGARNSLNRYLGIGPIAQAQNYYSRHFRTGLAAAMAQAAQIGTPEPDSVGIQTALAESTLIASLGRSPFLTLSQGTPRIILYSDLARFRYPGGTVSEAKQQAREAAEQIGLDLQRSELYVIGLGTGRNGDVAQEAAISFFLTSQANLVGLSSAQGLPQFLLPPARVTFYQGRIRYPNGEYPARMRLSVDRNGDSVNSWIAVQTDLARYTPFSGVLACRPDNDQSCEFIGDRVFAQIWSDNPDTNPEFPEWMPFSGLREMEFFIEGDQLSGRAYDSSVTITGLEDNALHFEMVRMATGSF
ncbi:hypothetical protein [Maricaulis maris]|uniref:Uncharacterized protein n=1 Tax=Maricaulis maris TaxID=74318 RepID=A0A495DDP8_9PROT|nr:hypothetical protein [Maricaulis maris]RKR00442.1 hypothetical protein C7435_1650 [Maricaulis maris]